MLSPFLHPFTPPRKQDFLSIVGGKGAVVWDDTGKEYIDGMASLWYVNIGHGREEMADAIAEQARTLAAYHTFDPYTTPRAEEAAARIVELSPLADARVFMGSSGSEAVDTAMKLARIAQREAGHPERQIIVSRERGYHGTNYGGTSVQGIAPNREGWGSLVPGVINVSADDEEAMKQVFADHGDEIAAIITEPLQGAGGVWPPPPGYLEHLADLCDAYGAYLIHDEVITGFGRLGTWFGSQFYGVTPDMIVFAKAVTSGYVPLSGVIVGPAVRAALEANEGFLLRTGFTYSGHPLACAAALKAIEIQEREGLLDRARVIGGRLEAGLRAMQSDGLLTDVRGEGAVWGISLPAERSVVEARDALLGEGVIVRPIAPVHLSMCPPLVITDEQIDVMLAAMRKVFAA
ncbi:MAG: aminotransferase class III-fold pyridoxal phosphate-dependent enzyme [Actinobacteria bacterium]|nr:aminotransferase class III-fold pyridoxal phosphate-dependent enzyme [Actinomycetota bacterium]MBU1493978.1 aminotransferase class III-fold pyridoxal phosphate-dependent enzyme [Actinomycetota bacterium]MBU1864974.1 aminotransferase class III-fold pyridoxal phosphate-dependent enzyme [Actinomycetota bacterium]